MSVHPLYMHVLHVPSIPGGMRLVIHEKKGARLTDRRRHTERQEGVQRRM